MQWTEELVYKNNYYAFNLRSISPMLQNKYFILEVTNKKAEKKYLRFKY
jgi:hypothetical protein